MKKAYLFVYNLATGTREEIRECIDNLPQITYWRTDLPNSFYLISELNAEQLTDLIREKTKKGGRFIIAELVAGSYNGYLPPDAWFVINNKRPKS